MQVFRREDERVLAIDPTNRGFGFAVLEGAGRLIDWGIRDTGRADNGRALRQAERLLDHYTPDALVVEDACHQSSRRTDRIRELIRLLAEAAEKRQVAVSLVPRTHVYDVFGRAGAPNKERIAGVVAEHFPELAPRRPPHRKAWMSEDVRGSIFDATAMALVYYFGDGDSQHRGESWVA